MRFIFMMNMPANKGGPVHQIIADMPHCSTLESLCALINERSFIVVEEYYYVRKRDDAGEYIYQGKIIVSTEHIGKIKEARDLKGVNI